MSGSASIFQEFGVGSGPAWLMFLKPNVCALVAFRLENMLEQGAWTISFPAATLQAARKLR